MSDISDISYPEILPANDLTDLVGDDMVQGFQLETNAVRGRSVRLGAALNKVLSAHDYPPVVANLVGETMTLTVLLASMLKFEGIFTLQIKGDGPINMLVADMMSDGALRGCATFEDDALAAVQAKPGDDDFLAQYMGKGYDGTWRAGGMMLQQIPDEGGKKGASIDEEEWNKASVFMGSASDDELLDPALPANELLHRLYHEEGVRVYEPLALHHACRCDEGRVHNVLSSMSAEDIKDMAVDGVISMRCEFCSYDYRFDPETLKPVDE